MPNLNGIPLETLVIDDLYYDETEVSIEAMTHPRDSLEFMFTNWGTYELSYHMHNKQLADQIKPTDSGGYACTNRDYETILWLMFYFLNVREGTVISCEVPIMGCTTVMATREGTAFCLSGLNDGRIFTVLITAPSEAIMARLPTSHP